jgi:hypothetical protein
MLRPGVQTAAEQPVAQAPVAQPPIAQAPVTQPPAGIPMQPPHGTRLWRSTGDDDETPVAVYDAIGGVWSPARTDAVPAPRAE